MIKLDYIKVFNFEGAIRGMRNPFKGTEKSDSRWKINYSPSSIPEYAKFMGEYEEHKTYTRRFEIGKNDLELAKKLANAGPDHGKFLRQIQVSMDITAPLFWWKEADTYKIATVANSESTMHTIEKIPFTIDDFTHDSEEQLSLMTEDFLNDMVNHLNWLREKYLETKDKQYWRELILCLGSSYNQRRTWTCNYATLKNIYSQRKNHKLSEWKTFCEMIETLPYKELIII